MQMSEDKSTLKFCLVFCLCLSIRLLGMALMRKGRQDTSGQTWITGKENNNGDQMQQLETTIDIKNNNSNLSFFFWLLFAFSQRNNENNKT